MKPDEIDNPAWDYIKKVPNDDLLGGYMRSDRFTPANFSMGTDDFVAYRDGATSLWTWAIPDPEVLAFLQERLQDLKVVEVGAGNGYWAWLLTQLGVDVNAYDIAPMGHEDTWFETGDGKNDRRNHALERMAFLGHTAKEYHPVIQMGVEALALPENKSRILFLCWPPYDNPMAADALRAFQGDLVIYIGENGGCNADADFHDLVGWGWWNDEERKGLTPEWKEIESHPMIQWGGIHDNLHVFQRLS